MNIKRIFSAALVLAALVAVLPASGYAADDAKDLSVYFRPAVRFGSDHRTLFILDLLAPVYRDDKGLFFVNAKFTPSDVDSWEVNAGLGYRRLVVPDKLVLGGNLFYDHRKTSYGSHFNQIGLGFEALADVNGVGLTGRVNYYQPLNKAKIGTGSAYEFFGNGIYGAGIEEPMTGFDYEAGVRIPGISNYMETWAYAGGYNFFGTHVSNVNGFSARLEAMPTDFLRLNFEFRNDNIDHDQYYGEVAFEVPFSIDNLIAGKNPFEGMGDFLTGSRTLKERMVEPVRRDVDIYVKGGALSPADAAGEGNLAEGIIFVADNAGSYPGTPDGSFEHPYPTFTDAVNDSAGGGRLGNTIFTIHVLPGDGSGLSGEDFYIDGLTIWGAGATNPKYPNVANFTPGYPVITNGYLYLDAANTTVLGLEFDTYAPDGAIDFGGNAAGAPFTVTDNIIHNFGYGIVADIDGDIGAEGSPAIVGRNTIQMQGGEGWPTDSAGIYLNSESGSVYASIFNNDVSDIVARNSMGVYAYGIYVGASNDFTGSITGNDIHGISAENAFGAIAFGIYADVDNDLLASISGNHISDVEAGYAYYNEAGGIYAYADNDVAGSITGNVVEGVYAGEGDDDDSTVVEAYGITVGAGNDLTGSITGNTVEDIGADANFGDSADAYGIYAYASGNVTGGISGNTINGIWAARGEYSYAAGIDAESEGGDYLGSISGNTVNDVWADYGNYETWASGIYAYADYDFAGSITGNTVSSVWAGDNDSSSGYNGAFGISADVYGDFTGSITGNKISDIVADDGEYNFAGGVAINYDSWWYGESTGAFNGTISGNTISGITSSDAYDAEAWGIFGYVYEADFNGSITNNTIRDLEAYDADEAYAYGIITLANEGNIGCAISGNSITNLLVHDADYAYAYGIYSNAGYNNTGSIFGNTVAGVSGYDAGSYTYAYGIYDYGEEGLAGEINQNTITGISSPGDAMGIYLSSFMHAILTSVTNNTLVVTGGNYAYGLYANNSSPDPGSTLGTASTPLVFTGNSGTINGASAYVAYLDVANPEESNVYIGPGGIMGNNHFITTGVWAGNYPDSIHHDPGAPIWASGYPTYNYIHP
jgi:hypothetical protein